MAKNQTFLDEWSKRFLKKRWFALIALGVVVLGVVAKVIQDSRTVGTLFYRPKLAVARITVIDDSAGVAEFRERYLPHDTVVFFDTVPQRQIRLDFGPGGKTINTPVTVLQVTRREPGRFPILDIVLKNEGDSPIVVTELHIEATQPPEVENIMVACSVTRGVWAYHVLLDAHRAHQTAVLPLAREIEAGRAVRLAILVGSIVGLQAKFTITPRITYDRGRQLELGPHTLTVDHKCGGAFKVPRIYEVPNEF